jgi:hypothetical protein
MPNANVKRPTGWPHTLAAIAIFLAILVLFRLADIYGYLPILPD